MQSIGFIGEMLQLVVNREDRVGTMTEERSDMMMVVVPNHLLT